VKWIPDSDTSQLIVSKAETARIRARNAKLRAESVKENGEVDRKQ